MATFFQDVAYGLRLLRRAPGFTAAAVLTLALGIGVNAATVSIINVRQFMPLAYDDPGRVAFVMGWDAARSTGPPTSPELPHLSGFRHTS